MTMNCPSCQTVNPAGARFCFNCGTALPGVCTHCQAALQPGARFCHNCGQPVASAASPTPQPPISPPAAAPSEQLLQRYLPRELLARLESARSNRLMAGERRVVSILFCDVQGSTAAAARLDPEEWAEVINGAFAHMIQPVYHYEGTVARLQGDGLLAFFGAPIAHEDDPERAVLAGLEITQAIQDYAAQVQSQWGLDLSVRVGVNTGLVVVGEVGSDLRVEYTALGDAINLAARMEQSAQPGTVLVASATHKLVAPLFEFEVIPGLQIKGYQEPLTAYRPTRRQAQRGSLRGLEGLAAPLIGRQAQLQELWSAAEALKQGSGQIVAVVGEAGLGKSRLVSEFGRSAQADPELGLTWLEGRALSYQSSLPFAPFIDLLRRFFNLPSTNSPFAAYQPILERLQPLFDGQAAEIAPFLASLLGLPLDESTAERVKYIPPPRLRYLYFEHLTELLRRLLAAGPLVIYLDDLHWSDPTSIELLLSLLQLTDHLPVLVLAAFRPRRSEPAWEFHVQAERDFSHRYRQVSLQPLDASESRQLVSSLLEIDDLPERVRQKILEKAEGNPFFVEEVIRSLLDNHLVVRVDNHWQATQEINTIDLPDTLVGVITARMDRLSDQARQVLQAASVLGREFSAEVLEEISRTSGQSLEDSLVDLQRRELVREKSRLPQRIFSFKHGLTREAAYNSILLSSRRELHRLAAEATLARTPEAAAEIAQHLLAARLPGRAILFLVQAGDQASRAYAIQEAIGFYRQALEVKSSAGDPALVRRAYEGLGNALSFANQIPAALETLQEMRLLAKTNGDIGMQISALNKLASITALHLGQFPEAEALLAQADQLAQEHNEKSGVPETNLLRCQMCSFQADFEQVVFYMEEVVKVGEELDIPENIVMGLEHVATSLVYLAQFDQAQQRAEQGLRAARQVGDREHESWLLTHALPMCALHRGDLEGAESHLHQALEIANRIGLLETQSMAGYLLGEIARWRGDYEQALSYAQTALQAGLPLEQYSPYFFVPVLGSLGMIFLEISPQFYDQASAHHRHALRLLESPMAAMSGGLPWADLGHCALMVGDLELAQQVLDTALNTPNIFSRLELPRHLAGAALLACARGELQTALSLAQEACRVAEESQLRWHAPLTALVQGNVRLAAGQLTSGLAALEQAVQEADRLGMRPIAWQAQAAAANALIAAGRRDEASKKSQAARALVNTLAGQISDPEMRQAYLINTLPKIPTI